MKKTAGKQSLISHGVPGKRGSFLPEILCGGQQRKTRPPTDCKPEFAAVCTSSRFAPWRTRGGIQFTPFADLTSKFSFPDFF